MAAQLNYGFSTPKGVAGGKVDLADDIVASRTVEAEDGVLKFGMAVAIGTNAGDGIKMVSSSTTANDVEGVLLHAANTEQDMSGKVVIKSGSTQSVMKKGHVWGWLSSDAVHKYGAKAYVVVDGDEAGSFTHASAAASVYVQCDSSTSGAKEVVADDTASPTANQIKISAVTPGYVPAVGDYVVSKQIHGATVDIGAVFGNASDTGIAVIEL